MGFGLHPRTRDAARAVQSTAASTSIGELAKEAQARGVEVARPRGSVPSSG
jgi:hypothetical protein